MGVKINNQIIKQFKSKAMKNLKLKIGETYKLRNGLITSPLRKSNNGTNYKFEADVIEPHYEVPSIYSWKLNGRFLTDSVDNRYDIIELV